MSEEGKLEECYSEIMENYDSQKALQHFILTRFNLLLWNKDKKGSKVRTVKWLDHRFELFEKYCLPSIKNQTCQNFEWIVLFDSFTPEKFKAKIADYQRECPQFIPVFVEPQKGRYFAEIFRREIVKRLKANRVVSTYLDNDDALNVGFVEDLQHRALAVNEGTFINYNDGYQYYSEDGYLMRIYYPTNHFVSVVEKGDATIIKGIFGYGSHAFIHQIKGVTIEHVRNILMWCEVVHGKNMINDAHFLKAKMVKDGEVLKKEFAIEDCVQSSIGIYIFKFLPRYAKTFVRNVKERLIGRKW
jgi:glycosyltransferase involved in cell wall biosynthesis